MFCKKNVGSPFWKNSNGYSWASSLISLGNKYLLVIAGCFVKWSEAIPLKNKRARFSLTRRFVGTISHRRYHQGRNRNYFESQLFKEIMILLGIRKTRTTALHPQSDRQVERQHQTILNYLAKFISKNQKDWDR